MNIESEETRPELVFALVGPAGVPMEEMLNVLKGRLEAFGYTAIHIHLSELLKNFTGWTNESSTGECNRVEHRQNMALKFRKQLNDGAALVRSGIVEIRNARVNVSGDPNTPAYAHAYILDQLKHPKEVELLREVYGDSFFLLAGHATANICEENLSNKMAESDENRVDGDYGSKAKSIMHTDDNQEEEVEYGQNTRDTYPLADFFADFNRGCDEYGIKRFVDLLFGHPYHTPSPKEFAMHQAWSGSLRSSDVRRQVGAVIAKHCGYSDGKKINTILNIEIVAIGMNEVPRSGGGYYWDGQSPDNRDQNITRRSDNRANIIKRSALKELLDKIKAMEWLNADVKDKHSTVLARELFPNLRRTQFMNIGEFMRTVHAEMAALIDSASRGVAVQGLSMYVTTFPCHNCAKHIIAAGIKQVIYLEPYPKSRAADLHKEEIDLNAIDGESAENKVAFTAFTGIAPRQYQQLFSMCARGANRGYSLQDWEENQGTLSPRYVMGNAYKAYLLSERQKLEKLPTEIYSWDKNVICPLDH